MTRQNKRSLLARWRRLRLLWKATLTGAELGYTGPGMLAELNPRASRHWAERLQSAKDPEDRHRAAYEYLRKTLKDVEAQAAKTGDSRLQAEADRARDWLAEHVLAAVSLLERAQRQGGHEVPGGQLDQLPRRPDRSAESEPVDLDEFTTRSRRGDEASS